LRFLREVSRFSQKAQSVRPGIKSARNTSYSRLRTRIHATAGAKHLAILLFYGKHNGSKKLRFLREVFHFSQKAKVFDQALKAQGILRIHAYARVFMRLPMRSILRFCYSPANTPAIFA